MFGICNEQCFDSDGVTPIEFEDDDPLAFFCKTEPSECQFPFIWNDVTYNECTTDGGDFAWCALEVDSEGRMVSNRSQFINLSLDKQKT